jgi:hypothetical protein
LGGIKEELSARPDLLDGFAAAGDASRPMFSWDINQLV